MSVCVFVLCSNGCISDSSSHWSWQHAKHLVNVCRHFVLRQKNNTARGSCCCCCDSPAALLLSSVVYVEEVCDCSRVVSLVVLSLWVSSDGFDSWTGVLRSVVPLHTPDKRLICRPCMRYLTGRLFQVVRYWVMKLSKNSVWYKIQFYFYDCLSVEST